MTQKTFINQNTNKMRTVYPTHPARDFNEWITGVHNYFRMTVAEYIRNKYIRQYTKFRIVEGKGYYIVDEKMIPQKEFESKFPLPLVLNKADNPDKTKDFMNDSY